MKPIITGFYDHHQSDLQSQIDFAVSKQLSDISLRNVNGHPLYLIDQKTYQEIISTIKKGKIKVSLLDPNMPAYDLEDDKKHQEAMDVYKDLLILAQKIKTTYILLRLPKVNLVIEQMELIKNRLEDFIHLAQQYHRKLVLEPSDGHKASTYAYILKKIKTPLLNIQFNPVYFLGLKESTTTVYRLFKKKIVFFRANDATLDGQPQLLGHGKTDFLKVSKKLLRDKFDGYIMVDNDLHQLIENPKQEEKKSWFKQVFKKKDKKRDKAYQTLKTQLKWSDEEKNVTYDDILENQIKLINYIFK